MNLYMQNGIQTEVIINFGWWLGSCVLNSNGKIKDIILQVMKDDPTYFSKHSIAHVLFDDKYFNGLGTYTVSEVIEFNNNI